MGVFYYQEVTKALSICALEAWISQFDSDLPDKKPVSHSGRLDLPCKQTPKGHRRFESYIRLEYPYEGIPGRLLDETTSRLPAGTVASERNAFSEKPELVHVT